MHRTDFNPPSGSSMWRPTSAAGRPSMGGRLTSRLLHWCYASVQSSAPNGAVPNPRMSSHSARASSVEGRPSFGGLLPSGGAQATASSSHSMPSAAPAHLKPSRPALAVQDTVALVDQTAGYGLPNPRVKRTRLRAAYA